PHGMLLPDSIRGKSSKRSSLRDAAERSEPYHRLVWPGKAAAARGSQLPARERRGCFQKFISVPSYRDGQEDAMAQEPLATKGNFLHIYDFRVTKGKEEEFIRSFEEFDYSDGNPMHKSRAQVKDGVLCRDTQDPQRFFL